MLIILRSSGRTGQPRRQEWLSWSGDTGVTVAVNVCGGPGGGVPGGDAAAVVMAMPVTLSRTSAAAVGMRRGMNAISPG
ncbi:hypothetical protein GCM10023075_73280 [Streptosporangium album]